MEREYFTSFEQRTALKSFLRSVKACLWFSDCKSEILNNFGLCSLPSEPGQGDFGVGNEARLCFCSCKVQLRSLAVLRGEWR